MITSVRAHITAWQLRLHSLLLGLVLSAALASAVEAKEPLLFTNISTFTLANGMQVVVIPDHRAPVVTHMVWYKVGAADEPPGESGIAHFLEHLMFKGTDKIPAGQFSKIIREQGGEDNAFTSADYTAYFQRIAKERLPMVMEMEADRMLNLKLSPRDVETEREVILEERRSRIDNEPEARLMEQMDAALFLNHPYHRPVIGWMSEMQQLSQQDALDFYKHYYTPSNAILVVAGDVTADEVRKLAETHYGGLKNTAHPGPRERLKEPEPQAQREVVLRDAKVANARIFRTYLAVAARHAEANDAPALDVLGNLLGAGSTSLLYRDLVVDKKLATSASAWYDGDKLDYGTFGLYVEPLPEADQAAVDEAIDQVLTRVKTGDFSDQALSDSKSSLVAQAIYALDSQMRLAQVFGTALTTGQSIDDVQLWPQRIRDVTKEQVVAVANKYLQPERMVVGRLLPAPGAAPSAPEAGAAPVVTDTPPAGDVPASSPAKEKEGRP
ncbi:M16 family metallopeptidase [Rhodoligotrophos defluvii]|uniref:M16 family metallopeptidase n=1 Tax=Rhodoligotrophos defluvii TaxID=2561934 RepID=UPI001EF13109|nr:pitrilysin family protein [Rhodoligotrophos defluvii]